MLHVPRPPCSPVPRLGEWPWILTPLPRVASPRGTEPNWEQYYWTLGSLSKGGLAVYHVDMTAYYQAEAGAPSSGRGKRGPRRRGAAAKQNGECWPYNGKHYMVALIQVQGWCD